MTAVACPKCFRQVSLPSHDDRSAWVRCPLCRARYPLEWAFDSTPPMLEIVAAPAPGEEHDEPQHAGAHEHFGGHEFGGHGAEFGHEGHGEHELGFGGEGHAHEHFAGEEGSAGGDEHDMGGLATMVRAAPPARKRKKTPASVIVIGLSLYIGAGLVGLYLVYGLFLFVGGVGYDKINIRGIFPRWVVKENRQHVEPPAENPPADGAPAPAGKTPDAGAQPAQAPAPAVAPAPAPTAPAPAAPATPAPDKTTPSTPTPEKPAPEKPAPGKGEKFKPLSAENFR